MRTKASHMVSGLAAMAAFSTYLAGFPLPSRADNTVATSAAPLDPHANESKSERDSRMMWWREARYGMFIHWGLYAQFAGSYDGHLVGGLGEWIMHNAKIPVANYTAQAQNFDPEKFDATEWVAIAKASGMKYIVMTAKHHEGFAMYHTSVDGYNIYDATPFKRDPIEEMAAACKKAGIRFGVYYSQNLDWHHPGGGTEGPAWDTAQVGDYDEYIMKVSAPQVAELISRVHPAILWFDIAGKLTDDEVRALTTSFPKDPELIYNNRMGGGIPGDYFTPEQRIPPSGYPGKDWETCMTINDTWGYKRDDTDFKPATTLVRNLIDIASKGGNYLVNVGPDPTGVIPDGEVQRLKEVGTWLAKNGETIYGTSAGPFLNRPFDGRATVKGHNLYLNIFNWPDGDLKLPGLQTAVVTANAVASGEKLTVTKTADGTELIGKPSSLDPISTAVVLHMDGAPVVKREDEAPKADGSYELSAGDATLSGSQIVCEGSSDAPNIGYWFSSGDSVSWNVTVPPTGSSNYTVGLDCACDAGFAGSTFSIVVDGKPSGVGGTVTATKGWSDYHAIVLDGRIALGPGSHSIGVKPVAITKALMNLRSVTLTPVGK